MMRKLVVFLTLLTFCLRGWCTPSETEARSIISEYALVLGRCDALSTYLSPLNYHGFRPSLKGHWSKGMRFSTLKWRMHFDASIGGGRLINSPGTAVQYTVGTDFSWAMERQWCVGEDLTFSGGGSAGFIADIYWLTRNSNNPVSLSLWTGVSLAGSVSYNLTLGKLPVTLSERLSVPTLGAFFMPGYGESFYEIYVGNHKGLAHCGWWGNAPGVRSHLEVMMHFGHRSLTLGYLLDCRRFEANHLAIRQALNAFTLGLRF